MDLIDRYLVAVRRHLPRPLQKDIVGPALYPYYRQALVIVLFWIVLPVSLGGGALAALYSEHSASVWGKVLGAAWTGGLYSIGIVTIAPVVGRPPQGALSHRLRWRAGPVRGRADLGAGVSIGSTRASNGRC